MIFNIRRKFLLLVLAAAFIGIAIYFYELPTVENHTPLTGGQKILHSELANKYSPQKNGDRSFNTNDEEESRKKEIFEMFQQKEKTKYPLTETAPKDVKNGAGGFKVEHNPTETTQVINQTLWEWLNSDESGKQEGEGRSKYYCREKEDIASGTEGQVVKGFMLEHVHVVIRHGDRSPIYSLPRYGSAILDCYSNYSKQPDEKIFRDYLSYMQTVWEVLSPGTHGAKFGLFPRNKKCEGAQLTPKGVLQHLKNGEFLRKIYVKKLRLFTRVDIHSKVVVRTTDYTRTYQSALAFAYGFIPDFDYFKLKIKFSRLTNFCSKQFTQFKCECKTLTRLQNAIEEEYSNRSRSSKLHNEIKQELADIFDVETGRLPWIAAVLDVVMGNYCHGLSLPCLKKKHHHRNNNREHRNNDHDLEDEEYDESRQNNDKNPNPAHCVTPDLVSRMWKFLDHHGRSSLTSYPTIKSARLAMHPLITEIYGRMQNVTKSSEKSKFYLYSGHDTTIAQLKTALGISNGIWPPYASRLIFELYSGRQELKKYYFIRVLYNGKDVTQNLIFCKNKPTPHGLCPLDYFKNFCQFESLKAYGTTDYTTACQI